MNLPEKAVRPTMYFIGVTTAESSIMKLFPLWTKALSLGDAVIKGIDVEIHAKPETYRQIVEFIKNDELSMGALVTTHKIDLYEAAKDQFEYLDPYARMFGELSSISKKNGKLEGYAKDPISSGLSMEAFIPPDYWKEHGGEVFVLGAGGSAIAIISHLFDKIRAGANIPSGLVICNRSLPRLEKIKRMAETINPDVPKDFVLAPEPGISDEVLRKLKPYSVIVNATGLGKDRPGSPLSDSCEFPENSIIWELNYRGKLDFMHQALKQKEAKKLQVEDGWFYFIHGWTQVIAEVFHIDITGERFDECKTIAYELRKKGQSI